MGNPDYFAEISAFFCHFHEDQLQIGERQDKMKNNSNQQPSGKRGPGKAAERKRKMIWDMGLLLIIW